VNKVQFKPCNHFVCIACSNALIDQSTNVKCPYCRGNVEDRVILNS